MKRLLVAVMLAVGCGNGVVETQAPPPDMAPAPVVYETNAGADCIPEEWEAIQRDCPCVPPLKTPAMTASVGAYCKPETARCCAWYVVGPPPFATWTDCGDGWKCEGDGC